MGIQRTNAYGLHRPTIDVPDKEAARKALDTGLYSVAYYPPKATLTTTSSFNWKLPLAIIVAYSLLTHGFNIPGVSDTSTISGTTRKVLIVEDSVKPRSSLSHAQSMIFTTQLLRDYWKAHKVEIQIIESNNVADPGLNDPEWKQAFDLVPKDQLPYVMLSDPVAKKGWKGPLPSNIESMQALNVKVFGP